MKPAHYVSCSSCLFFKPTGAEFGMCRRRAPHATFPAELLADPDSADEWLRVEEVEDGVTAGPGVPIAGSWPEVHATDFCGEYREEKLTTAYE